MNRKISTILRNCELCQKSKHSNQVNQGITSGVSVTNKNEILAIDYLGPLPTGRFGLQYIFVVVDIFTKFTKLYPVKRATTQAALNKIFSDYIPKYGKPIKIHSDNATQFKSNKWIKRLKEEKILSIYSPIRHPQPNLAERVIKETKRCLRTYCHNNQKNWPEYIVTINECLNEIYNETTGYTPNELHLNKRNDRFWNKIFSLHENTEDKWDIKLELAKTRLQEKKQKRANKINSKNKITNFNVNDLVLLKSAPVSNAVAGETKGLFLVYEGPYKIHKKIGNSTYMLSNLNNLNIKGPYHITHIKKYYH